MPEVVDVYPQPPHRHLCLTGRRLHQEWLDALETHVPDEARSAMQAYFIHLNGVFTVKRHKPKWTVEACCECEPYRTGER
jgi:DNA-binding FadR family transcriptional regulator